MINRVFAYSPYNYMGYRMNNTPYANFSDCDLSSLINAKKVALSSSASMNPFYPYSAIGLDINSINYSQLDYCINHGLGVGINFSKFSDPCSMILDINSYFKSKEKYSKRPPAGIALLDINHPRALDFIKLKDNCDYSKWCFDLSVILDDNFMKNSKNNPLYTELLKSMRNSGEPGIIFSNNPNYITDPCGAVELKKNEAFCIGFLNMKEFFDENKKDIDYKNLAQASLCLNQKMKQLAPNSYIGVLGYQDLLDKFHFEYGSYDAIRVLENFLSCAKSNGLRLAISPSATTSKRLNVTPNISPRGVVSYDKVLNTISCAQKYLEGNISNTIALEPDCPINDIDYIIQRAYNLGIRGLTVFPSR